MGPADPENRFPVGCVLGRRRRQGIALARPQPVQSTVHHHHSSVLTLKKQKKSNDCLGGAVARVVVMGSLSCLSEGVSRSQHLWFTCSLPRDLLGVLPDCTKVNKAESLIPFPYMKNEGHGARETCPGTTRQLASGAGPDTRTKSVSIHALDIRQARVQVPSSSYNSSLLPHTSTPTH